MALKPLNSVAGFSVGETPSNVILGNGDITANNFSVTGTSNLNSLANIFISGGSNGQVIQTDGSGNLSFVTIDTWRIQNGNSNVQALANSNVTVTVSGNANIAVFTSTGVDVNGYLTVNGNVTANGNLSANNYLVTPATKDLIVAPATQLTRVYSNVNPYSDATYDLGNGLARWNGVFANTGNFTGNIAAGGLLTNNLYYANGQPWDLQEAAGSNTQIQYNSNNNFGASANFTYDDATQQFTVNGNSQFNNANLGNLGYANFVNVSSNLNVTDTANVGNLRTDNLLYANGQPWDLQEAAGSNTQIQYNDGNNNFGASANFTYNDATQQFTVNGNAQFNNANLGNLATANFVNVSSNIVTSNLTVNLELSGNTANFTGNVIVSSLDVNNVANLGNLNVVNNVTSSLIPNANGSYTLGNATTTWGNIYATNFIGNITGNFSAPGANTEIIFNDNSIAGAAANFTYDKTYNSGGGQLNVGNTFGGSITTDDLYVAYANVDGNIDTSGNINATGNLDVNNITASGNIQTTGSGGDITMSGGNITGVNDISANTANFAGNVTVNGLTVNNNISGNTANFSGNISAANANLGNLVTANYINAAFDINALAGNMLANGNVTANGFLNGANANVTGQVQAGSVLTANITAPSGNITISAAGVDQNIVLNPTGNGTVDTGMHKITQVGDPTNPKDAVNKEYVDNIAQGLSVHPSVRVTSTTNLNATYTDGGTALTTTTIAGGKTITFSANHGLSIGDEIYWTNSFNGIISNDAYFVYSTPALNQITVKAGFYGAEVTTLTNGTGLTQPARGNPGVGATLTNAGANVAITIDSIALALTNRVLVQGQTNAFENGVYTVTTVGDGSTAWVLTRAVNEDQYDPKSTTGLGYGDYFFVTSGTNAAGSSYVLTSPVGEIVFGVTNIGFTQFSASGSYTAGNGIAINGTIISANTDGVTTDIVAGNIVVKAGANLTTPNLGDATFSSLSWNNLSNGNVTANNLSIANLANITGDFTVNGNSTFNNLVTINNGLEACTGNIDGSNASFSANVTINDLVVNTNIGGNTANFTGNISAANANLGNLVTANYFTGTLVNGTSNAYIDGTNGNFNVSVGGTANVLQVTSSNANITGNLNVSGNFNINNIVSNVVTANNAVNIGNTTITWDTVTTTSVTANQTIASLNVTGVTGLEFLVKAVDSGGSGKYSIATVQAVTDGTNVDYATFGTVQLGGYTGSLAVNVVGGYVRLQVTPASSNSTVWTTQARTI